MISSSLYIKVSEVMIKCITNFLIIFFIFFLYLILTKMDITRFAMKLFTCSINTLLGHISSTYSVELFEPIWWKNGPLKSFELILWLILGAREMCSWFLADEVHNRSFLFRVIENIIYPFSPHSNKPSISERSLHKTLEDAIQRTCYHGNQWGCTLRKSRMCIL